MDPIWLTLVAILVGGIIFGGAVLMLAPERRRRRRERRRKRAYLKRNLSRSIPVRKGDDMNWLRNQ